MFRPSCVLLFVCAPAALSFAAPLPVRDASPAQAQAALAQLPLRFEANQGQFEPSAKYVARAAGYTLLLTAKGPVLVLGNAQRVNLSLLNSNTAALIEPDGRLAPASYFLGKRSNWRAGVPSYSHVRYRSVYPGVDVIYYGSQRQLEYDFVLAPGADPAKIRMQFGGGARISATPEGDLVIDAGSQRIVQKKPHIYQQDGNSPAQRVDGHYVMLGRNTAGFHLNDYDRSRPLVIDPVLVYSTYVGGIATDRINAVKIGPNGRLYLAGQTSTGDIPATDSAYKGGNSGIIDIFVMILDTTPGGGYQPVYTSYLGGSNNDIPMALDVDTSGVLYLTGSTTSTDFPMAANAFQSTGAASTLDAFVVKLDPSLSGTDALVYSSYLGGATGSDVGNGIAVGMDGMIYIIGTTRSSDFPVTDSAYQMPLWGPQDTFLCKIDPNAGALVYSTYLGGEDADDGRSILVGPDNKVYFGTSTLSTQFPMAGYAYNLVNLGGVDLIIGVMDMTKSGSDSLVYCTYLGGSQNEELRKIAFDGLGNLLVTGYTLSKDFPITPDALQPFLGPNGNAFVAMVNPANNFQSFVVYSTFLGGSGGEVGHDVLADGNGNILVTGYTQSKDFPVTPDATQGVWGQGTDMFLTKFKPRVPGRAALQTSTYFGATNSYVPTGMALGNDGAVYIVGYAGSGLPTTANAAQPSYGGGQSDGFVLVLK